MSVLKLLKLIIVRQLILYTMSFRIMIKLGRTPIVTLLLYKLLSFYFWCSLPFCRMSLFLMPWCLWPYSQSKIMTGTNTLAYLVPPSGTKKKSFHVTDTRTEARTGSSQLDRIAPETVNRLKNWRKIKLGLVGSAKANGRKPKSCLGL